MVENKAVDSLDVDEWTVKADVERAKINRRETKMGKRCIVCCIGRLVQGVLSSEDETRCKRKEDCNMETHTRE